MDAKPSTSSRSAGHDGQESDVERYGPLALRRLRKEDGRHLIAYTRVDHDAPADPAPASEPDAR